MGDVLDKTSESQSDDLARLCRYYLDCISHDDQNGISVPARSRNCLQYAELSEIPLFGETESLQENGLQELINRSRHERKQLLFGYPISLMVQKIEPIFLYTGTDDQIITWEGPQLNFAALKGLSGSVGIDNIVYEAIELAEALGLDNPGGTNINDLTQQLCKLRPDWDWQEDMNPESLSSGTPLSKLNTPGIYNRAVLISSERPPYTRGLETELNKLAELKQSIDATALGAWLRHNTDTQISNQVGRLIEVFPLNAEQRTAIKTALTKPLTVITGPPGTGKSQLVSALLANTARQGKKVLFSSKNNMAVDVVETRVNNLGNRPALLRLGSKLNIQQQLAEHLTNLLATNVDNNDEDQYQYFQNIHDQRYQERDKLDHKLGQVRLLSQEVDQLEQAAEAARKFFSKAKFHAMTKERIARWQPLVQTLQVAMRDAIKEKHNWQIRFSWPLWRAIFFRQLNQAIHDAAEMIATLEVPKPEIQLTDSTVGQFQSLVETLSERFALGQHAAAYHNKLKQLQAQPRLEEITKQQQDVDDEIVNISVELWKLWLRLQPARLSSEGRSALNDYATTIKQKAEGQYLDSKVYRRYYNLFSSISAQLPCWAIASLSAKSQLPFEPNSFDLLIIDEASQCDIASALPLLYRAKHAVIIGDPMQLRHITRITSQENEQLLEKHHLIDTRPQWTYRENSLYDLALGQVGQGNIIMLKDHHRSHAEIIDFSNQQFYEGQLRIATKYANLKQPEGYDKAIRWIDVKGTSKRPTGGGAINDEEAAAVVAELKCLVVDQAYHGTIGVVSPFRAQVNKIRRLVDQDQTLSQRLYELDFVSNTAHGFQGNERDLMIFSPVISDNTLPGTLNFLSRNRNLFNVAITRARAALIVIGNITAAKKSNIDYLAKFAVYVQQAEKIPQLNQAGNNVTPGPQYPPVAKPENVSDWEKRLYRALYQAGVPTLPQYNIDQYILDLAILQDNHCLDIEVDGERYHRNWDGELYHRDQLRDARLMELGWQIMRFWVYEIRDDLPKVIARVRHWYDDHNTRSMPE